MENEQRQSRSMEQCCEIVGVIVEYLQALSLDTRTAHGTPFFKVRFDCTAPIVLLCSILPDSAYNRVDDALAWNIECSLINPTTFENADIDPRISPTEWREHYPLTLVQRILELSNALVNSYPIAEANISQ